MVISVQQALAQQSPSTAHLNKLLSEKVKSVIAQGDEFPEVCVTKPPEGETAVDIGVAL